jgi:hypothetical protein
MGKYLWLSHIPQFAARVFRIFVSSCSRVLPPAEQCSASPLEERLKMERL